MQRVHRICAALLASGAAVLLTGAKPVPSAFTPALSYVYGGTDIRLSNADGSQAVLLVRMPLGPNTTSSILHHALAPLGKRQAAFVYRPALGTNELRLVDWTQPTSGGPLSVTLDPTPLLTLSATGIEITSVDFSPDGSRIAVMSWVQGRNQELRFFDVATRTQIGNAIPLAISGPNAHYRTLDGSLLMRGTTSGFSTFKDGVQTALFYTGAGGYFDAFNGTAADVVIQNVVSGQSTLYRWDGIAMTNGAPLLTSLTSGYDPSASCDNSRMIFQRVGSRTQTIIYAFATRTETLFSNDGSVSLPTYPNICG